MTCEQALILVSGAVDGANTEEENRQLELHLNGCPSCQAQLKAFREIDAELAELEQEPPEGLHQSVMEQIRREASPKKKKKVPAWAGLAVAAALATVLLYPELPQSEPATLARTVSEPNAPAVQMELSGEQTPQSLADELGADVVVTDRELPELELCVRETLEDGSVLYWLETARNAEKLSEAYTLPLYRPEQTKETGLSYALLIK